MPDIELNFSLDFGRDSAVINEITTTVSSEELEPASTPPPVTSQPLVPSPRAIHSPGSSNNVVFPSGQLEEVEDITQSFEITFETQLPPETTTPLSLAVDTTALFLEQDSSCSSGLVCGGRCLQRHQVCDSLADCEEGQDEAECGQLPVCREGEFACLAGRCLPRGWRCDGKPDCGRGEDEVGCSASCPAGEFLCGEGFCLPSRRTCDGRWDCGLGEDEAACGCSASQFQCSYGGGCVPRAARCDGTADCADRSDELGCRAATEPACGDWRLSEELASQLAGGAIGREGVHWPTLALLFNVKSGDSCTVSILAPHWLATSHSCLAGVSTDPLEWVLFGGPQRSGDNSTQIRIVADIVSHPGARRGQHLTALDLALVRLQQPLDFNPEVAAVCLATEEVREGQLCVSAGWASAGSGVSFEQYLTYLPEPLVPAAACNSSALYNGQLSEAMVCSKANGDSAVCHEDLGGPLMCLSNAAWQLQGVLSSHGGCRGEGPRPAVLTSVPALRDWVIRTIGAA